MRVVKRDGTIGPPAPRSKQCPPHSFNYVKRVNGVQDGSVRCSNCLKAAPDGADEYKSRAPSSGTPALH